MKRILLTITAALLCLAAYAQAPITGTWVHKDADSCSNSKDGVEADMAMDFTNTITLKDDHTYLQSAEATVSVEGRSEDKTVELSMEINGSIDGTWTLADGILTLTPPKKAKPKVEVKSENFPALLRMMLVKPITKEVQNALKAEEKFQVISVTDKELTVKDGKETLVYSRK